MRIRTVGLCLALLSGSAFADDAAITFGGSPKILEGHPSVRMVRERVVVTIGLEATTYDCTFEFKNEGAACKVRIGFPDRGEGADATEHMVNVKKAKSSGKPLPTFRGLKSFRSYVDGAEVKTDLARVGEEAASWHTKVVHFAPGQTRKVRDTFSVIAGGGITYSGGMLQERTYVMSTGASWKGTIGEAEVVVKFLPGTLSGTPAPKALKQLDPKADSAYMVKNWDKEGKSTVAWTGFATPTVRGRELVFRRKNFEPDAKSDIRVFYSYSGPK